MSALPEISPYLPAKARNPMVNFQPQIQTPQVVAPAYAPRKEIEYVKGLDGANNYNLGPNSSTLVLDQDQNVLWVIATDQNGSKSLVKGYWLGDEYVPPKPVTMDDLMTEIRDMKSRMIKLEEESTNGKHYQQPIGQSKSNGSSAPAGNRNGASAANGKYNRDVESTGPKDAAGV